MSLHEQLCCVPILVETQGIGMCASCPLLSMNSWAVGPITRVVRSTYLVAFWTRMKAFLDQPSAAPMHALAFHSRGTRIPASAMKKRRCCCRSQPSSPACRRWPPNRSSSLR